MWGFVGDVTITNGGDVTIKFCCTKQDYAEMGIDLPNGEPFKMLSAKQCPVVKGDSRYICVPSSVNETRVALLNYIN